MFSGCSLLLLKQARINVWPQDSSNTTRNKFRCFSLKKCCINTSVPPSLFLGYASIKHLSKQPLNSLTPEQYELNHWFNNIPRQASKRVPELINQPLPAASGNMLNIFILHRNQSSNKFQHSTLRASLAWWSFRINKLVFQADLNDKTSY